ncbi:hypothetical protein HG531_005597 [Fusarium graminearum]|nr:hypothetical protein HG531_005597 [Fusarium graminearum]
MPTPQPNSNTRIVSCWLKMFFMVLMQGFWLDSLLGAASIPASAHVAITPPSHMWRAMLSPISSSISIVPRPSASRRYRIFSADKARIRGTLSAIQQLVQERWEVPMLAWRRAYQVASEGVQDPREAMLSRLQVRQRQQRLEGPRTSQDTRMSLRGARRNLI